MGCGPSSSPQLETKYLLEQTLSLFRVQCSSHCTIIFRSQTQSIGKVSINAADSLQTAFCAWRVELRTILQCRDWRIHGFPSLSRDTVRMVTLLTSGHKSNSRVPEQIGKAGITELAQVLSSESQFVSQENSGNCMDTFFQHRTEVMGKRRNRMTCSKLLNVEQKSGRRCGMLVTVICYPFSRLHLPTKIHARCLATLSRAVIKMRWIVRQKTGLNMFGDDTLQSLEFNCSSITACISSVSRIWYVIQQLWSMFPLPSADIELWSHWLEKTGPENVRVAHTWRREQPSVSIFTGSDLPPLYAKNLEQFDSLRV